MIVSIDPGVHEAGVAVWYGDGPLASAWLVRLDDPRYTTPWAGMGRTVANEVGRIALDAVVIERPQVYVHSRAKGDPNDLITLALAAGAMIGAMRATRTKLIVVEYKPAEWKGQVPKDVMTRRIKRSLTEDEHERVRLPSASSLAHNVWDAVGIGLHHLRSKRRRDGEEKRRSM
jgi:Holliday junction resolvasome RuvABC endonuclease subunit